MSLVFDKALGETLYCGTVETRIEWQSFCSFRENVVRASRGQILQDLTHDAIFSFRIPVDNEQLCFFH